MADDEDILRVHALDYWQRSRDLNFSEEDIERLEISIRQAVVDLLWRATGGTILASDQALKDGMCVLLGGGYSADVTAVVPIHFNTVKTALQTLSR